MPYLDLVEELARADPDSNYYWNFRLKNYPTGKKILALKAPELRLFVLAALFWLDPAQRSLRGGLPTTWVREGMLDVLRKRLPFEEGDLLALLAWCSDRPNTPGNGLAQLSQALRVYSKDQPLSEALRTSIKTLSAAINTSYPDGVRERQKLVELLRRDEQELAVAAGEPWADAVWAEVNPLEPALREAWVGLFAHCAQAGAAAPSGKWLSTARLHLEAVGLPAFRARALEWLPLAGQAVRRYDPQRRAWDDHWINPANNDVLRGLVWMAGLHEDAETGRALAGLALAAWRKIPGVGPLRPKVGNACAWALGNMPGSQAINQLARLKVKVKFLPAQQAIEKALRAAAARFGLPPEEVEELALPTFGLDQDGRRVESFGETRAELLLEGSQAALRWSRGDGKPLASAPKAVKDYYAAELKELAQAQKDLRAVLPALAARLEGLYLQPRRWRLADWRARYLDHPVAGALARRLIWEFQGPAGSGSGAWDAGRIVAGDGSSLDWLDEETQAALWHPLAAGEAEVEAWRAWLENRQVRQPFKQAHREIYLLTGAERATHTFSNRFAAHLLNQRQFHALCLQRGWRDQLRLAVDAEAPPPHRLLPASNLRAEFWVESAVEFEPTVEDRNLVYPYVATDQVRFYALDAGENLAHVSGGGYHPPWRTAPAQPLPLDSIPPLVFSEIMRDIDLFVGVSSVGNDPNWTEGGRSQPYTGYWTEYSFGELSETARTRRAILARLLPGLKIGAQCALDERFLIVKGKLHTYKIHLGSGNVLMEPGGRYLCIVNDQRADLPGAGALYLPFEGDRTLALILSKAILLATDERITDATIRAQIRR